MEKTPETHPETINPSVDPASEASTEAPRTKKKKSPLTAEMKADPVSRKLILLSLLFACLAIICIGFLTSIYYQKKRAEHAINMEVVATKPPEMISQALTEIHVKLKNEQDLRVELVVECSQKETCDYVKENPEKVRDLLIPILNNIDSNQFSNIENKKLVRKKLTDILNTLKIPGKVIQIHFNNLSIEGPSK